MNKIEKINRKNEFFFTFPNLYLRLWRRICKKFYNLKRLFNDSA